MSFMTGTNYKTHLCKYWMRDGQCKYMSRCRFAHGTSELRNSAPIATRACTKQLRMILTTPNDNYTCGQVLESNRLILSGDQADAYKILELLLQTQTIRFELVSSTAI